MTILPCIGVTWKLGCGSEHINWYSKSTGTSQQSDTVLLELQYNNKYHHEVDMEHAHDKYR